MNTADPSTDESGAAEASAATTTVAQTDVADTPAFSDFDVNPLIVQALHDVGITHTFAIQALTLPIALAGNDLIGQARTGSGKTLGFGVPLLNRLNLGSDGPTPSAYPQALVIAPTRELAVQVAGDLSAAGKKLGARVLAIYGGRAYEPQIESLGRGIDVVVGTPGRLLDLVKQGHLHLSQIKTLVLDEADEMLDLGFLPDIEKIMATLPAQRQTLLFSATMPGPIVALARQFLNQPIQIRAEHGTGAPQTEHIDQFAYRAHSLDKSEVLARILQASDRGLTMIFVRTKRTAAKIADDLQARGFAVAAVHGDLGQGAREQALRAFRTGKVDVLVATDVAARGLDVDDVTHVINYQAPEDEMTYVHRIGRTARAGKSGTAITLVDWEDVPRWKLLCDKLSLPFHEPVETYSTSEHLYIELSIPRDISGTLPRTARTRAGLAAEEVEDLGGTDRSARSGAAGRSRGPASARDGSSTDSSSSRRSGSGSSSGRSRRRSRGAGSSADNSAHNTGRTGNGGERAERPRVRQRTRGGSSAGSTASSGAGE